jgi:hypothetical protein
MPDWYHSDDAVPVDRLVAAILKGVEQNRRAVYHPPVIRLLGLNGIAPRLTDAILRRLRGGTAAPNRD